MRPLRALVLLPAAIIAVATVFAIRGDWPWERLTVAAPIVVSRAFAETVDTLHRGETLSDLFARNRVGSSALGALAAARLVDPGRVRAGLVFNFRRDLDDSVPSGVFFRTSPEQRVAVVRTSADWSAEAVPVAWRTETVVVRAISTRHFTPRWTARCPIRCLTPDSGCGWPGTWPTSTCGRWTSPGTSSAVMVSGC